MELALQVKVSKVASFVGKIFRGQIFNHENHEYFAPRKLPSIRYISYSYNTGTRDVWNIIIALKHEGASPEG